MFMFFNFIIFTVIGVLGWGVIRFPWATRPIILKVTVVVGFGEQHRLVTALLQGKMHVGL